MDNEMFSMVLDTLKKIEREKLTIETKLEMDKHGDFPEELSVLCLGLILRFISFLSHLSMVV